MAKFKQDSNLTGLRIAEEASLKTLPVTPTWFPLEPNSYSDFGGQLKTVARNPINPSRQRKKGAITDLDASGGFNQDFTLNNLTRVMQGMFFADAREKFGTDLLNSPATVLTSVTSSSKTYAAASGLNTFLAGALVLAYGFAVSTNNGLKTVVSKTSGTVVVAEALADEASPAAGALRSVGFAFPSADLSVVMSGALARLTSASKDMTTLGLVPGEWIYVGGDAAGTTFASVNKGFARVSVITATYLELDKTDWIPIVDAGTGKTIQLFFGTLIKNESDPTLIKRRTYQVERTLGQDDDGTMSEYLIGAVANELTLNVPQADKVTADLTFVALDNEQRPGITGLKSGNRPSLNAEECFNTSSDISRIRLGLVDLTSSAVTALFAFATEMTLTLKNGVTANKALGVLGGFDTSAGTFEIGGKMTAYFASITAVQAVRNNADVTIDIILSKPNSALLFDIPLLGLGDGRLAVEQDKAITLPLEMNGAESKYHNTLSFMQFPYLPNVA